jgi:hypothetical protein
LSPALHEMLGRPAADCELATSLVVWNGQHAPAAASSLVLEVCPDKVLDALARARFGEAEPAAGAGQRGGPQLATPTPIPRGPSARPAIRSPAMRGGAASPDALRALAQPSRGPVRAEQPPAAPAGSTASQLQREAIVRYLGGPSEGGGQALACRYCSWRRRWSMEWVSRPRTVPQQRARPTLGVERCRVPLLHTGASSSNVADLLSSLARRHLRARLLLPGNLVALPVLGYSLPLRVVFTDPPGGATVTAKTAVSIAQPGQPSPSPGAGLEGEDVPMADYAHKAALAAAEALGSGAESAGPAAARRAAVAGQTSLGLSYGDLGGFALQVRRMHGGACAEASLAASATLISAVCCTQRSCKRSTTWSSCH